MKLTPRQRALLVDIVENGERRVFDGNMQRTARALIRRDLAYWHPPPTRSWLRATQAGKAVVNG